MRILYIVHRLPYPPDKGDKIRSFRWLEHLARKHTVHLATLCDDPSDRVHLPELESRCRSVVAAEVGRWSVRVGAARRLLAGDALSPAFFRSAVIQRHVDGLLDAGAVDVVLCFSSTMAEYVAAGRRVPTVMDMVDVDSEKFTSYASRAPRGKRWIYAVEGRRLASYEDRIARRFDATILCTEPEAELLRARNPNAPIVVVGNGVIAPAEDEIDRLPDRIAPRMIFVGAMNYLANVDAVVHGARDVLPIVRRSIPDAEFIIVGRDPTAEVRALQSIPGVTVTGAVDDLESELAAAQLALVPLRIAQGIQNKVLEAMSWRLPVVTVPKIAASLGCRDVPLAVGVGAEELAARCIELMRDESLRARLGDEGRRFVRARFDWQREGERLEGILDQACASRCVG